MGVTRINQERKRRFEILSGNIKPVQTSFSLKSGETAYYEFSTERLADHEYVESHTEGKTRSPFIQQGILRGNTKVNVTTSQERVTKNEVVDSGKMLFTNKRLLFIGKEIVSIPFNDILNIQFLTSSMQIKYPSMLKNESYDLSNASDAELYYKGIMRCIGRDKTIPNEGDIEQIQPNPISKQEFSEKKWYMTNFGIIVLLFLLYPAGLFTMWKYGTWNKTGKWAVTALYGLITLVTIIGLSTPSTTAHSDLKQSQTQITTITAKHENPVTIYKTKASNLIKQFETEEAILDKYPPTTPEYHYFDDPVYIHADKVFTDINNNVPQFADDVPSQYQDYDQFLIDIVRLMQISIDDLVHPSNYSHGLPHVSDDQIALLRVKKDMNEAEAIDPSRSTFYKSEGKILENLYDTINTADSYH